MERVLDPYESPLRIPTSKGSRYWTHFLQRSCSLKYLDDPEEFQTRTRDMAYRNQEIDPQLMRGYWAIDLLDRSLNPEGKGWWWRWTVNEGSFFAKLMRGDLMASWFGDVPVDREYLSETKTYICQNSSPVMEKLLKIRWLLSRRSATSKFPDSSFDTSDVYGKLFLLQSYQRTSNSFIQVSKRPEEDEIDIFSRVVELRPVHGADASPDVNLGCLPGPRPSDKSMEFWLSDWSSHSCPNVNLDEPCDDNEAVVLRCEVWHQPGRLSLLGHRPEMHQVTLEGRFVHRIEERLVAIEDYTKSILNLSHPLDSNFSVKILCPWDFYFEEEDEDQNNCVIENMYFDSGGVIWANIGMEIEPPYYQNTLWLMGFESLFVFWDFGLLEEVGTELTNPSIENAEEVELNAEEWIDASTVFFTHNLERLDRRYRVWFSIDTRPEVLLNGCRALQTHWSFASRKREDSEAVLHDMLNPLTRTSMISCIRGDDVVFINAEVKQTTRGEVLLLVGTTRDRIEVDGPKVAAAGEDITSEVYDRCEDDWQWVVEGEDGMWSSQGLSSQWKKEINKITENEVRYVYLAKNESVELNQTVLPEVLPYSNEGLVAVGWIRDLSNNFYAVINDGMLFKFSDVEFSYSTKYGRESVLKGFSNWSIFPIQSFKTPTLNSRLLGIQDDLTETDEWTLIRRLEELDSDEGEDDDESSSSNSSSDSPRPCTSPDDPPGVYFGRASFDGLIPDIEIISAVGCFSHEVAANYSLCVEHCRAMVRDDEGVEHSWRSVMTSFKELWCTDIGWPMQPLGHPIGCRWYLNPKWRAADIFVTTLNSASLFMFLVALCLLIWMSIRMVHRDLLALKR